MLLADPRPHRRGPRAPGSTTARDAIRARLGREDGFLLVEVLISALLVAVIVVATFNGFDAANRLTIDQRRHAEAALLAAESNEQLRTDPATALDALEITPRSFEREIGGTKYKIVQEAQPLNGSGASSSCSAATESTERGANIEITSSVTWALLEKANRPAVKQASIITPPTGSALEIDVTNGGAPPVGVAGVTAVAKFTPEGSSTQNSVEGTTSTNGCVLLTGLASTSAIVEILEKANFVTEVGHLKYPTKTISIAPNITTTDHVIYDEGGMIGAEYTYKGSTLFEGKPVEGNTFVAATESFPAGYAPFQTGSPTFEEYKGEERNYETNPSSYAPKATTAATTGYAHGDLFPFPSVWTVFAGDCPKNKSGTEVATGKVNPGSETVVKVPLSYVNLKVEQGVYGAGKGPEVTPLKGVVLTNLECEGYELPNNAYGASVRHEQETTVTGTLSHPFQPFGKQKLCVFHEGKTFTTTFTTTSEKPEVPERKIYLAERSKTEREAEETKAKETREKEEKTAQTEKGTREAEEALAAPLRAERIAAEATAVKAKEKREKEETEAATAKAKREKEEVEATPPREKREKEEVEAATAKAKREAEEKEAKTAKEKREKEETEMTTARVAREKTEKEKRELWASEEKKGKITKKQREEKEATQTTERKTKEAAEKTAKETRAAEEAAAKTAKEKREKEETEAATAKSKRVTEEATAKTAREKRIKEESEATTAKEKRAAEEVAAAKAKAKREEEEAAATPKREEREKAEEKAKAPREKREKEEKEAPAIAKERSEKEKATEEKTLVTVESGKSSC